MVFEINGDFGQKSQVFIHRVLSVSQMFLMSRRRNTFGVLNCCRPYILYKDLFDNGEGSFFVRPTVRSLSLACLRQLKTMTAYNDLTSTCPSPGLV